MPLIITPKTYSKTRETIVNYFNAYKSEADFWHSNFKDFLYKARINNKNLFILFTGYGEVSVGSGLIYGYEKLLRKYDDDQKAFYIGRCFITNQTDADLNDIIMPTEAFSECSCAKDISERIKKANPDEDVWKLDEEMREKLKKLAVDKKLKIYEGKIFCKETFFPDFWYPFARGWGHEKGYIAGEVEAAAFAVSCHYIGIPGAALLNVKDTIKRGRYEVVSGDEQIKSLKNILYLIERSI